MQNLNQIKQYMNLFKNSNNPQALLQNMIQNIPQMKGVINFINQNGGDPKTAFYKMAEQEGVNPNEILDMLNK